jgi:uncharacterized integral membrane protein
MKAIKSILSVIIVVLILIFVLQNSAELSKNVSFHLNLYLKDVSPGELPLYSALLCSFFLGVCFGGVLGLANRLRHRAQFRKLNRLIVEKDRELNSLRNLPVMESQVQGKGDAASS